MCRAARMLAAAAFALLGMVLMFRPVILTGLGRIQADPGDARHLNYVLEHAYLWTVSAPGHTDFWSPPDFFPARNTAAYTETLLGVAPFYLPFRMAGLPPDTSFQLWTLVVGLLNFAVFHQFLRRPLGLGVPASAIGAFLFAFSSVRAVKVGHHHLIPHFFTVLVVWACVRLFQGEGAGEESERRQTRWTAVLSLAFVAQVYASFYLAWFLAFALALALFWALASAETRKPLLAFLRSRWRLLLVASVVSAAAIYPLAAHHLEAARAVGYRSFSDAALMLPRLQSWLNMGPYSLLYGSFASWPPVQRLPLEWEHRLGLGIVTPVLVAWGLVAERRRPMVRLGLLTAASIVLLVTMFPGRITLWRLVFEFVPGAGALRAVARVAVVLLVITATGAALAAERIGRGRRSRWLLAPCLAFVILEQVQSMPSYEKLPVRAEVSALARSVPRECDAFYYAPVRPTKPNWEYHLDAMWASVESGVPTVNGYSSNLPPGWTDLFDNGIRGEEDVARLERALSAWMRWNGRDEGGVCLVRGGEPAPPGN